MDIHPPQEITESGNQRFNAYWNPFLHSVPGMVKNAHTRTSRACAVFSPWKAATLSITNEASLNTIAFIYSIAASEFQVLLFSFNNDIIFENSFVVTSKLYRRSCLAKSGRFKQFNKNKILDVEFGLIFLGRNYLSFHLRYCHDINVT